MPKVNAPFTRRHVRHPYLRVDLGDYSNANLGDAGGLTQFGAHLEILHPGAKSSERHWHEDEDEFLFVVSGELTLVEDTETTLRAGDAAAWPAGSPVAHRLENRTQEDATYLIVGTRLPRDVRHFPDHGIKSISENGETRYLHEDGAPAEKEAP